RQAQVHARKGWPIEVGLQHDLVVAPGASDLAVPGLNYGVQAVDRRARGQHLREVQKHLASGRGASRFVCGEADEVVRVVAGDDRAVPIDDPSTARWDGEVVELVLNSARGVLLGFENLELPEPPGERRKRDRTAARQHERTPIEERAPLRPVAD